jgi:hypothetical protein
VLTLLLRIVVFVSLGVVSGLSTEVVAAKSDFLKQHLVGPNVKGETNFYLDLWEPPKMRVIAPASGLTNNHALFINSHGKGVKTKRGLRYILYPHEEVGTDKFFIQDIAAAVGTHNVAKIHNIVISGCNTDSSFSTKEIRKYFPNATNIIHSAPGQAGYQEMLFQLLLSDSSQIETLYQSRDDDDELEITNRPVPGSTRMAPYVASLFLPGKPEPYRQQKAGRELLSKIPLSHVIAATSLD